MDKPELKPCHCGAVCDMADDSCYGEVSADALGAEIDTLKERIEALERLLDLRR